MTTFARRSDDHTIEKWPYTLDDLRTDFPDEEFPDEYDLRQAADHGVFPLESWEPIDPNALYARIEGGTREPPSVSPVLPTIRWSGKSCLSEAVPFSTR